MAKRKNNWPIIVSIFTILLICLGGYAYYHYQTLTNVKNLDVKLAEVQLEDITWTYTDLLFIISIHNPNPIKTTVGNFEATIHTNQQPLTRVELPAFTIQSQETRIQPIAVRVSHLDIGLALFTAIKERQVNWNIDGSYTLLLPFGFEYDYTFSFNNDRTVSA